jgi:hypothetical protein
MSTESKRPAVVVVVSEGVVSSLRDYLDLLGVSVRVLSSLEAAAAFAGAPDAFVVFPDHYPVATVRATIHAVRARFGAIPLFLATARPKTFDDEDATVAPRTLRGGEVLDAIRRAQA